MPDIVDKATRSRMMSGIRSQNTKPERIVRSGLHKIGYRFGLNNRSLRGTPDLVLRKHRAVIFVHGCFWHGHECRLFRLPATNREFWRTKIARNRQVDSESVHQLLGEGWRVLIVWECALRYKSARQIENLLRRVDRWLKSQSRYREFRTREITNATPNRNA
ncbi:MAG TPA: DNA mismatch endonuclease Vsr [Rhizomicrobium sp.]|nr:DNA mismatch endonuclease Vsr [Rhizomicrobium sp.]